LKEDRFKNRRFIKILRILKRYKNRRFLWAAKNLWFYACSKTEGCLQKSKIFDKNQRFFWKKGEKDSSGFFWKNRQVFFLQNRRFLTACSKNRRFFEKRSSRILNNKMWNKTHVILLSKISLGVSLEKTRSASNFNIRANYTLRRVGVRYLR
jgi:hypothetical protein